MRNGDRLFVDMYKNIKSILLDLVGDCIKPYKRIIALQWTLLPLLYLINDFVCHRTDRSYRDFDAVKL